MQIYDVPQLSEMLKVSVKAVRAYLIAGRLKGRKVGKVCNSAVRNSFTPRFRRSRGASSGPTRRFSSRVTTRRNAIPRRSGVLTGLTS